MNRFQTRAVAKMIVRETLDDITEHLCAQAKGRAAYEAHVKPEDVEAFMVEEIRNVCNVAIKEAFAAIERI